MDKGFIEFQAEPFPVQKLFDADWKLKCMTKFMDGIYDNAICSGYCESHEDETAFLYILWKQLHDVYDNEFKELMQFAERSKAD